MLFHLNCPAWKYTMIITSAVQNWTIKKRKIPKSISERFQLGSRLLFPERFECHVVCKMPSAILLLLFAAGRLFRIEEGNFVDDHSVLLSRRLRHRRSVTDIFLLCSMLRQCFSGLFLIKSHHSIRQTFFFSLRMSIESSIRRQHSSILIGKCKVLMTVGSKNASFEKL